MKKHRLVTNIYQARGLRSRDSDGSNDAFVRVEMVAGAGLARGRTKTRHDTNFPVWYETVSLDVDIPEQKSLLPFLTLNMFDEDSKLVGKASKEFVGSARLDLTASKDLQWVKMTTLSKRGALSSLLSAFSKSHRHAQRAIDSGELLVSAKLVPLDDPNIEQAIPKSIHPKFFDCVIDIDVVSLFELTPLNARHISRPVLEFSIPSGSAEKPSVIQTDRVHVHHASLSGSRANGASASSSNSVSILQRVRIEVKLPKKVAFAPNLNVRLIDDCKPAARVIGTGSIYIGQFLPWVKHDELISGDAKRFIDDDDLEVTVLQEAKLVSDPEPPEPEAKSPDEAVVALDNVPLTPAQNKPPPRQRNKERARESVVVDMPAESRERQPLLAPAQPSSSSDASQPPQTPHIDPEELRDKVRAHFSSRPRLPTVEQAVGPADAPPEEPEKPRIKHSRMDQELERTILPPFLTCRLARRRGILSRLFIGEHDESGPEEGMHHQNIVEAGKLRGAVRVYQKTADMPKLQALSEVMKLQDVVVRIYVLKGRNFVPKVCLL